MQDRWALAQEEIDRLCDAYGRVAALLGCHSPAGALANSTKSVEQCRAEAHTCAILGQQLDKIPDADRPTHAFEELEQRLSTLRRTVSESVAVASDVVLRTSQALSTGDLTAADGRIELEALAEGAAVATRAMNASR